MELIGLNPGGLKKTVDLCHRFEATANHRYLWHRNHHYGDGQLMQNGVLKLIMSLLPGMPLSESGSRPCRVVTSVLQGLRNLSSRFCYIFFCKSMSYPTEEEGEGCGGPGAAVVKAACLESRGSWVRAPLWPSNFKEIKCFFPAHSQRFTIVRSLCDREVAWSASDPGLKFRILCLERSVISFISPSSGGFHGPF